MILVFARSTRESAVKPFIFLTIFLGWTTSIVAHPPLESTRLLGSPDPPMAMRAQRVLPRLTLNNPIALNDLPGRGYSIVLQTNGKMFAFPTSRDPDSATEILDLGEIFREGYQGRVYGGQGIANCRDFTVDPDFESNGYIYVTSNLKPWFVENGTRVSRFTVSNTEPPTIDPATQLDILSYPSGDHIGTCLRFGPDGCLYVSAGDGSGPFPPDSERAAQNIADLRGSIMRIDVRGATSEKPYRIPDDNPFVGENFVRDYNARGEIFSFGFRNAFRIAFDPRTGSLWVADIGWERCEMIHRTVPGGNHGWSLYEGPFPVDPGQKKGPGEIIPPAIVMSRGEAQSITGGVFVPEQADQFPGQYLFADFMNGAVWAADVASEDRPTYQRIADTKLRVVSFATSQFGDAQAVPSALVIDYGGGAIYELVKNEAAATATADFPRRLSETGLFTSTESLELSPGAIRYRPAATMWRDGAVGDRVVAIATQAPIKPNANNRQNEYPSGTIFANTILRDVIGDDGAPSKRRMETQVLAYDGLNWNPYTYAWNDEQTDAELVEALGRTVAMTIPDEHFGSRQATYAFMSRDQCKVCHHVFMQGGLSFIPQNVVSPGWDELADEGWVGTLPKLGKIRVDPHDESKPLDARARSYLDMNCAHCHQPAGGGASGLHLGASVPQEKMSAIDARPTQGEFGIPEARIISPGRPERSVLMYRLATTGAGHMPRLGSHTLDRDGAKLIWDWIASMPPITTDVGENEISTSLSDWRQLLDFSADDAKSHAAHLAHDNPMTAGLFETWIDPAKRVVRVGASPNVDAILALEGSVERGRSWFADSAVSQCRNCHRHQGVGQAVGPDLDKLVSSTTGEPMTRQQVLRQLLHPSEEIAEKWRAVTVLTTDGRVFSGLVDKRTEESLALKQASGQVVTISTDDIEAEQVNEKSLMPEGQIATLTPQELADLLAMLAP